MFVCAGERCAHVQVCTHTRAKMQERNVFINPSNNPNAGSQVSGILGCIYRIMSYRMILMFYVFFFIYLFIIFYFN